MNEEEIQILSSAILRACRDEVEAAKRLNNVILAQRTAAAAGIEPPPLPKPPVKALAEQISTDLAAVIKREKLLQLAEAEKMINDSNIQIEAAQIVVNKFKSLKDTKEGDEAAVERK